MANVEEINWLEKQGYVDEQGNMTSKGFTLCSHMSQTEILFLGLIDREKAVDIITINTAINALNTFFPKPIDLLLALTENERKKNG